MAYPDITNINLARADYLNRLRGLSETLAPLIERYKNPDTVSQIYDAAMQRARAQLAKEYAARGLSGSGEYYGSLANAMAALERGRQQDIEQRLERAAELERLLTGLEQQRLAGEAGILGAQTEAYAAPERLRLAQQQLELRRQALENARRAAIWQGLGALAGAGLGLYGNLAMASAIRSGNASRGESLPMRSSYNRYPHYLGNFDLMGGYGGY